MNPENEKYQTARKKNVEDNTGFSEAELDRDVEIRAGEWQNLRKFHAVKKKKDQNNSPQNTPNSS